MIGQESKQKLNKEKPITNTSTTTLDTPVITTTITRCIVDHADCPGTYIDVFGLGLKIICLCDVCNHQQRAVQGFHATTTTTQHDTNQRLRPININPYQREDRGTHVD
jgi:hypothetical protein